MSRVNFDSFRNTTEVIAGFSSLYNDGSAITLGQEPQLVPDMNFAGNWTIEFWIKSSNLGDQCLMSFPDGTGNRYLDMYVKDGDKVVTYYEGVEDIHIFTTDPLPLTQWIHVALCYNTSTNTLYTAANLSLVERIVTADPLIANDTPISLFRPVHADVDYFNGYIGAVRVRNNFYNYRTNPYFTYESQVPDFAVSSIYPIANIDDTILEGTFTIGGSGPVKQYHSLSYYNDTSAIATSADVWGGNFTKRFSILADGGTTTRQISWGNVASRGSHYYPDSKIVLTVNADDGNVAMIDTETDILVNVNNGGTYKSGRGDYEHRYFFGWKIAADGSTNQIFRMDEDGTNEITVDMITLTGTEEKPYGFALDGDSDRIFFHDSTTQSLRSIDYDLTIGSFTTWPLTLPNNDWGDIDYSQGFIFYGGIEPVTGGYNSKIYRFELETSERLEVVGISQSIRGGYEGTVDVFIHRELNQLWLAGESKTTYITGTNFDFYTRYMFQESVGLGTLGISWTPVVGATHYNVLQNGIIIGNTTDTSFFVSGLGTSGDKYNFTIESSDDDVTYTAVQYYIYAYTALSKFWRQYGPTPSGWVGLAACLGALDPYVPTELVISANNKIQVYNQETDTARDISPYTIAFEDNLAVTRCWGNKRFYCVPNAQTTDIYDMGVECEHLLDFTSEAEFLASPVMKVFTHSANIKCITSMFDSKKLYYGTDTDIRQVGTDGLGDKQVLITSSSVKGIGIDPYNSDIIIFSSANNLWRHDIGTDTTTKITTNNTHGNTHDLVVLDGTIYGQYYNRAYTFGLFTAKTDGTEFYQVETASQDGTAVTWTLARMFLMDHANSVITSYDRTASVTELYDANMPLLPSDPSLLLVKPSPIGIGVEWGVVNDAVKYGISYSLGESGENNQIIGSSDIPADTYTYKIGGVSPGQVYTVYLYYTDNIENTPNLIVASTSVTTPTGANGAADYDKEFFEDEDMNFDLTSLSESNLALISSVFNELFSSGDEIDIPVNGKNIRTRFVKRGETTSIGEGLSLSIPFTTTSGSSQSASLVLSDSSTVSIEYDETTEQISISGVSYSSGESFLLDGKKVTIYDI